MKANKYTDQVNTCRKSGLRGGDVVLMKNLHPSKADPVYLRTPVIVLHRLGNQVEIEAAGTGKINKNSDPPEAGILGIGTANDDT